MAQLTHEEFLRRLKEVHGDKYTALGKYTKSNEKIEMKCNICGHEWNPKPHHLIGVNKTGCPKCSRKNNRPITKNKVTQEEFEQRLKENHNGTIIALEPYKNSITNIKFKCLVCDHEWSTSPTHINNNLSGCPNCKNKNANQKKRFTREEFINRLNEYHQGRIITHDTYEGERTELNFECTVCGHKWKAPPKNIIRGNSGCPKCHLSIGELRIKTYLENHDYHYIYEYSFPDCRNINPLSFDFAIFENDGLKCLIEFDGAQHFRNLDFFGGEDRLKEQQARDRIKDDYCMTNNIVLLRIPYTKLDKIEIILDDFFSKL